MAKATVLYDAIRWTDEDGSVHSDDKGASVDLPQSEFDRLEALGAVAASGSKAASEADASGGAGSEADALMKAHKREELDEQAKAAGIANPEALENKRAVAEAIIAARG